MTPLNDIYEDSVKIRVVQYGKIYSWSDRLHGRLYVGPVIEELTLVNNIARPDGGSLHGIAED